MTQFVAGLALFFGAHAFPMLRGPRARVIDAIGALPYRGIYSLVAIAGIVLIVMGWGEAPHAALWHPPAALRYVSLVLMVPVFVLAVAANVPGHIKARVGNPLLLATKTWAFAHLLVNGEVRSVMLFGAFLAWAVVDLVAVKRQGRSAVVASPRGIYDGVAVVVGLGLYAAFVLGLHTWVAGVGLLPPR